MQNSFLNMINTYISCEKTREERPKSMHVTLSTEAKQTYRDCHGNRI